MPRMPGKPDLSEVVEVTPASSVTLRASISPPRRVAMLRRVQRHTGGEPPYDGAMFGGGARGRLIDRSTQAWVRATGRTVDVREGAEEHWLGGPVGDLQRIGTDFFERWTAARGWQFQRPTTPCGLIEDLSVLDGPGFDADRVHPEVRRFYAQTSEYDFDVWSRWCGLFRPFSSALALLFSRRLEQLNVPLSPLDTSLGIDSEIGRVLNADGQQPVRDLGAHRSGPLAAHLYVGAYSCCTPPRAEGPCLRVVFPLPNGHAAVIMHPEAGTDGSFTIRCDGRRLGDPGFYFFVESPRGSGRGRARIVRTMKETIRVFVDESGGLRADHELRIWGTRYLELHYRMPHRREEQR